MSKTVPAGLRPSRQPVRRHGPAPGSGPLPRLGSRSGTGSRRPHAVERTAAGTAGPTRSAELQEAPRRASGQRAHGAEHGRPATGSPGTPARATAHPGATRMPPKRPAPVLARTIGARSRKARQVVPAAPPPPGHGCRIVSARTAQFARFRATRRRSLHPPLPHSPKRSAEPACPPRTVEQLQNARQFAPDRYGFAVTSRKNSRAGGIRTAGGTGTGRPAPADRRRAHTHSRAGRNDGRPVACSSRRMLFAAGRLRRPPIIALPPRHWPDGVREAHGSAGVRPPVHRRFSVNLVQLPCAWAKPQPRPAGRVRRSRTSQDQSRDNQPPLHRPPSQKGRRVPRFVIECITPNCHVDIASDGELVTTATVHPIDSILASSAAPPHHTTEGA